MLATLLLSLLLLNQPGNVYFTDAAFFNISQLSAKVVPERVNPENIGVQLSAEKFSAIDVKSGKVLLQKNSNVRQPLASITKLMTALVILDQKPDWQRPIELQKIDETVGAFAHIYRGEEARFIDLWKSALITSDNNSIMAMIRALGFSQSDFVGLMNKKAREIGMFYSDFADPTGLNEKNESTALDTARLIYAAMQKNEIKESVLQPKYSFKILNSGKSRKIYNTDILVESFLNDKVYGYELIGGKTGYLPDAGYCLAVEINRNNHPVVIVVLNSKSVVDRFQDVKVAADWVYANYKW